MARHDPIPPSNRKKANAGKHDPTCRAVSRSTKTDKVLDLSPEVTRPLKGEGTLTWNARNFLSSMATRPPKIAAGGTRGRALSLLWDKVPQNTVRSHDDSIRARSRRDRNARLTSPAGHRLIEGCSLVDGVLRTFRQSSKGGDLVVYPKRGRTIVAFAPIDLVGFFGLYQVMAGAPLPESRLASDKISFPPMNVASTP